MSTYAFGSSISNNNSVNKSNGSNDANYSAREANDRLNKKTISMILINYRLKNTFFFIIQCSEETSFY